MPIGSSGRQCKRQREVGLGKARVKTVLEHVPGAVDGLFGGLADQHDGARPAVAVLGQPSGRADEARHVDVVAAGVHHADVAPGLVASLDLARVGKTGLLDDRQRVHVGANQHHRALAVLEDADDAELADVRRDARARLCQFLRRSASTSRPPHAKARGECADACRARPAHPGGAAIQGSDAAGACAAAG